MIDTDETGQKKLRTICEAVDSFDWSAYELDFIENVRWRLYSELSAKQKNLVGQLYDKLRDY